MSGRQYSLIYQMPPNCLLAPAADGAGRTSAYYTLKNGQKAFVVFTINQGNAATVLLSLLQAKDVSGTGSKAVTAVPISLVEATAVASFFVPQTPATTFTTDAALSNKLICFEIIPEACMDVANAFCTIAVSTGASNAANITAAHLFIDMSYEGKNYPDPLFN